MANQPVVAVTCGRWLRLGPLLLAVCMLGCRRKLERCCESCAGSAMHAMQTRRMVAAGGGGLEDALAQSVLQWLCMEECFLLETRVGEELVSNKKHRVLRAGHGNHRVVAADGVRWRQSVLHWQSRAQHAIGITVPCGDCRWRRWRQSVLRWQSRAQYAIGPPYGITVCHRNHSTESQYAIGITVRNHSMP